MRKFNLLFRQYILLWAFLAMMLGYVAGKFNHERVVSLNLFITPLLFLMVFIMVLPTTLSSLLKLKYYMLPMLGSLILFLISPLFAYVVSLVIPESFQFLRIGIIISSTVPPDAMLSAWTGFLEGDILFSLIIQSFTFLLSLFFMPFSLSLFLGSLRSFSVFILIKNLFFLILIPFTLAGTLKAVLKRYLSENVLKRIKPTLSTISGLIGLFIIMISVGLSAEIIAKNPVIILWGFLTSFFYYWVGFVISIYITRIFRFRYDIAIPLIYENSTRNLSIAMLVAITSFKNQTILGVAACLLAQFPASALFYTIIARFLLPDIHAQRRGTHDEK